MKSKSICLAIVIVLLSPFASAQWLQQGAKLVGTGAGGGAGQGFSTSISADGNTAIVGGPYDDANSGAAWVFTRTGENWSQQGGNLVGTGTVGNAAQGFSVSLSGDGNTAIVGGYNDSNGTGAAWVFTRAGSVWSQQGGKLVGTGAVGGAGQGWSVSISSDGNTAIVGGCYDSNTAGAAWVFTRASGVWSQQGSKLVGTGAVGGFERQGWSVSISSDGNTAIVGGTNDGVGGEGAVWVYARTGGVWSQQGSKLVGTGAAGGALQGWSVSLSSDGNTAMVGGAGDSSVYPYGGVGAAWVFTRTGGVWSQQGSKLVGTGAVGNAQQGCSVSLSGDGNTAILGGTEDNHLMGAAWVFVRKSGTWTQVGDKLVGTGAVGPLVRQGHSVSLSSDGYTAIVGGAKDNTGQDGGAGATWVYTRPTVGVTGTKGPVPILFALQQNYPNPFNPSTTIHYELAQATHVALRIYNALGQKVETLVDDNKPAGSYSIQFDGSELATGVYLFRIEAGSFFETRKMLLLK